MAKGGRVAQGLSSTFARHGGRLDDARAAFPHAPRPWIDLSTGLNPDPWRPPAGLDWDPAPLPCPRALGRLEAAAARHFGTDPARVAAVPGSEVAIRLLPALGLARPVVAAEPAYGTHGAVADERVPFATLTRAAGRRATMLLANPNNPDGRVLDRAVLLNLAKRQAEAGGWLAVDEAFADASPALGILPGLAADTPMLVFRSFGKFFGLAGVRLGFVVGPPAVIARYRALLGDWPVGAQATAWGTAAYADRAWIEDARAALAARAAALDRLLARHGLRVAGACPLFRLVEDARAGALFERLARAGILTRPFAYRPDWLRLGLPADAAAAERLDDALRGALAGG